jgi:hypothetical protein
MGSGDMSNIRANFLVFDSALRVKKDSQVFLALNAEIGLLKFKAKEYHP